MRNYESLDHVVVEDQTGIIYLTQTGESGTHPRVSLRREGSYIAISASYGPLEIAMRLRYEDLIRLLSRLRPVEGLQTTRQIGTGQAYISLGLQQNGDLVMRPTIVGDATGHMCLNLILTDGTRDALYNWLNVK